MPAANHRISDQSVFGRNALVAIVVLTLITIFLFREGFGFFGQNLANLRLYRQAGFEFVDMMQQAGRVFDFTAFFYISEN